MTTPLQTPTSPDSGNVALAARNRALRDASLAKLGSGKLSDGTPYEFTQSRKGAPTDGLHIVFSTTQNEADMSLDRKAECFALVLKFVSELPLAQEHGVRFGYNAGKMLTRPHFHIHIMIPGSDADVAAAPRLVDPWQGGGAAK